MPARGAAPLEDRLDVAVRGGGRFAAHPVLERSPALGYTGEDALESLAESTLRQTLREVGGSPLDVWVAEVEGRLAVLLVATAFESLVSVEG